MTFASATAGQNILSLATEGQNVFITLNSVPIYDFVYDDTDDSDLKRGLNYNAKNIYNIMTGQNNIQDEVAEQLLDHLANSLDD